MIEGKKLGFIMGGGGGGEEIRIYDGGKKLGFMMGGRN